MDHRGTITFAADRTLEELEDAFIIYTRQDMEQVLKELETSDEDDRPSVLHRLYRMLQTNGIEYLKKQPAAYYRKLIDDSVLPDSEEVCARVLRELYCRYENYSDPTGYMRRMLRKFAPAEDYEHWANDSLRLQLLKLFVRYGGCLRDVGYNGEGTVRKYAQKAAKEKDVKLTAENITDFLADDIFAVLNTADEKDKAKLKPNGTYGLLKLCDDLAGGQFRTQGATRRGLYPLAIVLGMTWYGGGASEVQRYETDITKNLFRDYYANNLMRAIGSAYSAQAGSFERDPSGCGINFQNFAEMVYLYYMPRDLAPAEKLHEIGTMIDRIKQRCAHKGAPDSGSKDGQISAQQAFSMSPQEFEDYLCGNYNCDIYSRGSNPVGIFQLETDQKVAFEQYQSILGDIEEPLENCNYGLWFTDLPSYRTMSPEELREIFGDDNDDKIAAFVRLLCAVDSFLGSRYDENELKLKADHDDLSVRKNPLLFIERSADMTRTAMVVAYYYYYNEQLENHSEQRMNFGELYEDFRELLDPILQQSGYQKISSKNIFDILVIFSSYARIHQ